MTVISGGRVIGGTPGTRLYAGTPSNGTSEVITLTVSGGPTSGTYKLQKDGMFTAAIAYSAPATAVQAALVALPTIAAGGVQVTGSNGGPYTVTASGNQASQNLSALSLADNSLVGGTTPTVQIIETTPGVDATARGAPTGTMLIDTVAGKAYINTGTAVKPAWTVVGSQS